MILFGLLIHGFLRIISRLFSALGYGLFRGLWRLITAFIVGFGVGLRSTVLIAICRLFLLVLLSSHFLRF